MANETQSSRAGPRDSELRNEADAAISSKQSEPNQNPKEKEIRSHAIEITSEDSESDTGSLFSTKEERLLFVRKVYTLVSIMLLVDSAMVAVAFFVPVIHAFLRETVIIHIVAYVIYLVVYIALICVPSCRRDYPLNYIMLSILVVAQGKYP